MKLVWRVSQNISMNCIVSTLFQVASIFTHFMSPKTFLDQLRIEVTSSSEALTHSRTKNELQKETHLEFHAWIRYRLAYSFTNESKVHILLCKVRTKRDDEKCSRLSSEGQISKWVRECLRLYQAGNIVESELISKWLEFQA